jgi:hypothetical protein
MPCCAKIESKGRPGVATVSGGRRSFWCDVEVQWGDPIATRQTSMTKFGESLVLDEYGWLLHVLMAKKEPAP